MSTYLSDDHEQSLSPEVARWGNVEDTTERGLLVVLLDISYSMGQPEAHPPIDELNTALSGYLTEVTTSEFAHNGELAIAAFYGDPENKNRLVIRWLPLGVAVHENSPVHWARHARPFNKGLVPRGNTPLGAAIIKATSVITTRASELADANVTLNPRPVLLVLTDGHPTDSVAEAAAQVHRMETEHELVVWIAGMRGADQEKLRPVANKGNLVELGTKSIASFIRLMSMSVQVSEGQSRRSAQDIYDALNRKWQRQQELDE